MAAAVSSTVLSHFNSDSQPVISSFRKHGELIFTTQTSTLCCEASAQSHSDACPHSQSILSSLSPRCHTGRPVLLARTIHGLPLTSGRSTSMVDSHATLNEAASVQSFATASSDGATSETAGPTVDPQQGVATRRRSLSLATDQPSVETVVVKAKRAATTLWTLLHAQVRHALMPYALPWSSSSSSLLGRCVDRVVLSLCVHVRTSWSCSARRFVGLSAGWHVSLREKTNLNYNNYHDSSSHIMVCTELSCYRKLPLQWLPRGQATTAAHEDLRSQVRL
jgi:hypothetical protein